MDDKKEGIPRGGGARKPNRLGPVYFIIACVLIAVPFIVYWLFILRPMQDMVGR